MTILRRIATGLAVVAGLLVLSATPSDAAPREPGDRSYTGPAVSSLFAGRTATGVEACVTPSDKGVYRLPCKSILERD